MPTAETDRKFSVHARHIDSHQARLVCGRSFEAAAVAYLEDFHVAPGGPEPTISVIVRDVATGHQHCFHIDLDSGATAPCG